MKNILLASVLLLGTAVASRAQVGISINIGTPPYFGYAPPDVVYVERYVPAYEVPRVLFVSRYAHVRPVVIVNRYRDGWGWDRICSRYRVPPQMLYGGPPYGNAYGYYRHHGKHWRR